MAEKTATVKKAVKPLTFQVQVTVSKVNENGTFSGIEAKIEWVTEPQVMNEFPYEGRKAGLIRGPAGELVEVILTD